MVQRSYEIHNIFESIWAAGGDGAAIQRVIQVFTANSSTCTQAMTYAQAHSIPIDWIAIAPYQDMDSSPTFLMAAAQMYAASSDSIANTAGPGQTPLPNLKIGSYNDMYRHHMKYGSVYAGPSGAIAQVVAARNSTGYGQGGGSGYVHAMPPLICYEASIQTQVRAGPSHTTKVVRAGLSHDLQNDPSYYDVATAFLEVLNQPGASGSEGCVMACSFEINSGRGAAAPGDIYTCPDGSDGNGVAQWYNGIGWQGRADGAWGQAICSGTPYGAATAAVMTATINRSCSKPASIGLRAPIRAGQRSPCRSPASRPPRPSWVTLTGTNTTWSGSSVLDRPE